MTLIWLGILNLSIGLITLVVAMPLAKGQVAMNNVYGVRFAQAMVSDENWYAINRYGGRCMIWWSVPIIVIGIDLIISFFVMSSPPVRMGVVVLFSLTTLLVLGGFIQTILWANKNYGPGKS